MKNPASTEYFALIRYEYTGAPPLHCMVLGSCTKTVTHVTFDQLPAADRALIIMKRTVCNIADIIGIMLRQRRK